jgi:hypothetical protein
MTSVSEPKDYRPGESPADSNTPADGNSPDAAAAPADAPEKKRHTVYFEPHSSRDSMGSAVSKELSSRDSLGSMNSPTSYGVHHRPTTRHSEFKTAFGSDFDSHEGYCNSGKK